MKKILAVSGGIDSVVMLHFFRNDPDVVVAHFDHGIRSSSHTDAEFVESLTKHYEKPFFVEHAKLGADCSEESARSARYTFLTALAQELNGKIYTAHHADDLIESVAINNLRGTGWRGLAALNNPKLERPLLSWRKTDIYQYATENQLHFRLDQTNSDDKYLRNRVREQLLQASENSKLKLLELAERQRVIAREIDAILTELPSDNYSRALMDYEEIVAMEILRTILARHQITQTRPQLLRAIAAIRGYDSGKKFPLGKDVYIKIGRYNFQIELAKLPSPLKYGRI